MTALYEQDNLTYTFYNWHTRPVGDCLFVRNVPITANWEQVKDYDIFWTSGIGFFDRMYAKNLEKLYLNDGWTPPPWKGQLWSYHVYTMCSGHALVSTLKRLGVDIQRRVGEECVELEIVYYTPGTDGNKGSYNVINTKTSTERIKADLVVVGVKFKDPWPFMIFVWFCLPLIANTDPMKWASNAEQFCAIWQLVDLHNDDRDGLEFQIALGTGAVMQLLYHLKEHKT
jgi:hypothetical protein